MVGLGSLARADEIPPEKARDHVGQEVAVRMIVRAAKNRLEKKGIVYLDSTSDFNAPENLAVLIKREAAEEMKNLGIADPAAHYLGKEIRVRGTVAIDEGQTRVFVTEAKRIEIVEAGQ